MKNLYPILSSKIIFRQTENKGKYKSELVTISGKVIDLNESSEKIVRECDGSNSTKDITLKLSKIYDKTPLDVIQSRTEFLLNTLEKQRVIEFLYEPFKGKTRRIQPKQPHGEYPLRELFVECTNACNLKCKHCYLGNINKNSELPLEKIKDMLDQFSDIGGESVTLSGGEPFLRQDILEIIDYASSRPLFISIFSNGILITDEIVKKLKQYNIKEVQISLDGAKPETHDAYRGMKGAHKATLRAIDALRREGIKVGVATIVNRINIDELTGIVDICKNWETIPKFSHQERKGRAVTNGKDYQLTYYEHFQGILKARRYISEKTNQKPFNIKVPEKLNLNSRRCSAGINSLTVLSNGDVYPCMDLNTPQAKLGNICEQSINEMWDSKNEFLNMLRCSTLKDLKFCRDCRHLIYCDGGCPAAAYDVWGDYNMPDPKNCAYFTMASEDLKIETKNDNEYFNEISIRCDK